MPGILQGSIWQFIGTILALASIVVSIVLYFIQRRRKALSYEVISNTPLLSLEDKTEGRLQILLGNVNSELESRMNQLFMAEDVE